MRMIVIVCDHGEGECAKRFEGFSINASEEFKEKYLKEKGWTNENGLDLCPFHSKKEGNP